MARQIAPPEVGVFNPFKAPQHGHPRAHQGVSFSRKLAHQYAAPGIHLKVLRVPGQA